MIKTEAVRDEDGTWLALFIRGVKEGMEPGVKFVTPEHCGLQVGVLRHPQGKVIQAHRHREGWRQVPGVTEVLFLLEGTLEVRLYGLYETQVEVMQAGDAVVLMAGGHGFTALTEVKAIEFKTGPYRGREDDKEMLEDWGCRNATL